MALTKQQELEQERKRNERLRKMVKAEREKVAGYEQIAKAHSAYIAILLKKLDANRSNPVCIKAEDVAEALNTLETRAVSGEDGAWNLYWEKVVGE